MKGKNMDKRDWLFEPNMENVIEVESVPSFLERLKKDVLDKVEGNNSIFFFRGQKTDFWDLQPSIFRDDFVSAEHLLMQVVLLLYGVLKHMLMTSSELLIIQILLKQVVMYQK